MRATLARQFRGQFAEIYNFGPSRNLVKTRNGIRRVLARNGRMRIACVGDSLTKGLGAGTSGTFNSAGAEPNSMPTRLAAYLNALGIPANSQAAICGFGSGLDTAAQLTAYDTRLAAAAGWNNQALGNNSYGGDTWFNNTTTNALSFTPAGAFDTIVLIYPTLSGGGLGNVTWDVDGGSATTISEDVAEAFKAAIVTVSLATHTINIKRVSGECYWYGWIAYNSAVPAVDVLNGGISGATVATWDDAAFLFSPLNALGTLAPDLTLITLGINDWESGVSQATYLANMQTLITKAKLSGDVILLMPTSTGATATGTTQQQFYRSLVTLADNNNVMLVDWQRKGISYAVQNAAGRMNDTLHPKAALYDDQAAFVARLLAAA